MPYIFRGRLCGYLCEECLEPLSDVKVRLYRVGSERDAIRRAVANPKETFSILSEEEVRAKEGSLLAEVSTDAQGNFTFELGEKEGYDGGAFEVDVYCGTVPHLPPHPKPTPPVQFSITTLQPLWRAQAAGEQAAEADVQADAAAQERTLVYGWDYCLPPRYWCAVRGRFGAWVICGRVTVCEKGKDTGVPVPNVKVRAFDTDWLQDDPLGAATTDAAGNFHLYYTPQSFRVTPFTPLINVEWVGGPDLYFSVETLGGTLLLQEDRAKGRTPGRENRGPCTCVKLCIDKDKAPPTTPEAFPAFTNIGGYPFLTAIDSGAGGSGLTIGDNRAFFSTLRLNGILSKTKNGNPLEYMFEVAAYDPNTNALGAYTQVPLSQIAPTNIGKWEHFTGAMGNPVETKDYVLNGTAGPNVLVPAVSPDGWVRVPQENNVFDAQGNFAPNGNMINLVSEQLRAFGTIDESAVSAGQSADTGGTPLGRDFYFSLRMWVRESSGGIPVAGSELVAGTCTRLAVMNTLYNQVAKGGAWFPQRVDSQLGVASLNIQELVGGGCTPITTQLNVLYTAAHPNLGTPSIWMTGPGGPYSFTLAGTGTPVNRFGVATNGFNIATLPKCAYIVHLSVPVLLTTGDGIPDPIGDELAFCKD